MAELLFPLAAVFVTVFLVVPALTLVSCAWLARRRARSASWADFGSNGTFALLVAPTMVPAIWLLSSAIHQVEPSQTLPSCWVDHMTTETCVDALILLSIVVFGGIVVTTSRAWRERPTATTRLPHTHGLVKRVRRIAASDASLRRLRIHVAHRSAAPAFAMGWLRASVVLDACFVRDADDEMIRAASLHERAHVADFDTARSFLVRLCLSVNPAGQLLRADFERWRGAREAQCDGDAVHRGGEPLALAESILLAARFECRGLQRCGVSLLTGHSGAALKLRLALLLDGPQRPGRSMGHAWLFVAVIAMLTLPHIEGAGLLDAFHFSVERLLHRH
ncbi:MAG: beta-lactamase regulating signal transducer with metallopeptidase domain [Flavobacteriales bacterium]|jgi:beta-lactamase regulating signal transducer with metallopeptidase domain